MYICVCTKYTYTHTHTHTHTDINIYFCVCVCVYVCAVMQLSFLALGASNHKDRPKQIKNFKNYNHLLD